MFGAGDRHLLMRRFAARHKPNFAKTQIFVKLERGSQMPVVNRVESSAKNSDRVHAATLDPRPAIAVTIDAN